MTLPIEKDIVAEGLGRLIHQWKDKPIVQGLVQAFLDNIQLVEDSNFQLLNERSVYTAIGAQLDVVGLLVGQDRGGAGDEEYRSAILNRVSRNHSDGTPEVIMSILGAITLAPQPKIWEHYPASIHAFVDRNVTNNIAATLSEITPAGVSGRLMFDRRGNSFRGADAIPSLSSLVLENLDQVEVDDGIELATLDVTDTVVVSVNGNSFLADLLNTQVINPLCEVIDERRYNILVGELTLENGDNLGLDNGDTLGYQILEEL